MYTIATKAIGRKIPQSEENVPKGKMHFFGIGIDKYHNWQHLRNAVNDIEGMEDVLHTYYDFDKNNIITLKNEQATRNEIVKRLHFYTQQNVLGDHDSLLIYFSGHGFLDGNDDGYWVPVDSQEGEMGSFVANEDILKSIRSIKCLHVLLISDSCYSGSLKMRGAPSLAGKVAETLAKKKSRWLLASGDKKETVADGHGKHSPFAAAILSELIHNDQLLLIADKLAIEVREIALNRANQMAQYEPFQGADDLGGRFVFRKKQSDETDWQRALAQNTEGGYAAYLENYPNGKYAKEAQIKCDSIKKEEPPTIPYPPEPPQDGWWEFILKLGRLKIAITLFSMLVVVFVFYKGNAYYQKQQQELASVNAQKEEKLVWENARKQNNTLSYDTYLNRYSQGVYVQDAQKAKDSIYRYANLASAEIPKIPQVKPNQEANNTQKKEKEKEKERERVEKIRLAAEQSALAKRNKEIKDLLADANAQLQGQDYQAAISDIEKILEKNGLSVTLRKKLEDAKALINGRDYKTARQEINSILSYF